MMPDMPKKRTSRSKRSGEKLAPLSEQLKAAILDGGVTRYRIAKDTGISEQTISKFLNGHQNIGLRTVDTIGQYLGLRLVSDKVEKGGR